MVWNSISLTAEIYGKYGNLLFEEDELTVTQRFLRIP